MWLDFTARSIDFAKGSPDPDISPDPKMSPDPEISPDSEIPGSRDVTRSRLNTYNYTLTA
jgi:hypothetical protein